MTKKFILFDHDGVLVDTEQWFYTACNKALGEIGVELSLETYLQNMSQGIPSWQIAKDANVSDEAIEGYRVNRNKYYQEYLVTEDIEIASVEKTLAGLSQDYQMAIITTSKRVDFELIHRNRKIVDYMDFILTLEDYDRKKPHPEPYLAGLEKFGAAPSETIVVEDSARGLKSAIAAKIDCVIVHNDFTASHNFTDACKHINRIAELPTLMDELNL